MAEARAAPRELPALPSIDDAQLARAVFTHQGVLADADSLNSDLSYERLEFLGDAYLECMASRIVYRDFPQVPAGRLAQMRESLINNWTLADFARAYDFRRRVRAPADVWALDGAGTKVLADVFEAYVAAAILGTLEADKSKAFARVETWLAELWAPRLAAHRLAPEVNLHAKQDLAKMLLAPAIKLEYENLRRPKPSASDKGKMDYVVGVLLTGWGCRRQQLGSGSGWSSKEAGTRAAMDAMLNRPLIDDIIARRKSFLDDRDSKRESEGQV